MITPRRKAIEEGRAWYMPDKPCSHCGLIAPKRVNNGECKGCNKRPSKALRIPPEGIIITAAQAKQLGYLMYYTGIACSQGHITHRYTSNRHCVDCHRDQ